MRLLSAVGVTLIGAVVTCADHDLYNLCELHVKSRYVLWFALALPCAPKGCSIPPEDATLMQYIISGWVHSFICWHVAELGYSIAEAGHCNVRSGRLKDLHDQENQSAMTLMSTSNQNSVPLNQSNTDLNGWFAVPEDNQEAWSRVLGTAESASAIGPTPSVCLRCPSHVSQIESSAKNVAVIVALHDPIIGHLFPVPALHDNNEYHMS